MTDVYISERRRESEEEIDSCGTSTLAQNVDMLRRYEGCFACECHVPKCWVDRHRRNAKE